LVFFYAVFWSLPRAKRKALPCGFLFIELCQCFCQPGCLDLPARCLAITLPLGGTLIACNLAHSTPGERGLIILLDVIAFDYRIVLLLDQKPFGAFTSRTAWMHVNQRKIAFPLFTVHPEFEVAFIQ